MKSLKNKILSEIKSGKVKMKPRWEFELWDAGVKSVWASLVVIGAIGVGMIIVFWGQYRPIETTREFGEVGRQLVFADFPYWWLVAGLFSLMTGTFLLTKIGRMYRQPMEKLLLIMAGAIIVLSVIVKLLKIAG